jgi:hypothetical protein
VIAARPVKPDRDAALKTGCVVTVIGIAAKQARAAIPMSIVVEWIASLRSQ